MSDKWDFIWDKYPERKGQMNELCQRIKPLVRFNGILRHIKPCDPFKIAYAWSPVPSYKAKGYIEFMDIVTYHAWAYYGFFKPSISEVIAQIPHSCFNFITGFEIIQSPQDSEDLNKDLHLLNMGYHKATTRLYIVGYKPSTLDRMEALWLSLKHDVTKWGHALVA